MSTKPLAVLKLKPATQRVDLAGDYAGGWVELLLNPPAWVADVFQDGALAFAQAQETGGSFYPGARHREAVAALLRDWNLADEQGTVYPPTAETLARCDWGVTSAIMDAYNRATALPKANGNGSAAT